jgi:hypothetical protein
VVRLLFGRLLLASDDTEVDMSTVAIADAGETP